MYVFAGRQGQWTIIGCLVEYTFGLQYVKNVLSIFSLGSPQGVHSQGTT